MQEVNTSAITPVPRDTEVSSLVLAAADSSEEVTGTSCFTAYPGSQHHYLLLNLVQLND